jgi:hypothetical protein
MLSWLKAMGSKQAHICTDVTGRHSLGVALALHDAGHVVSVVNSAQIRDFARTKLGRNKTDKVDAALIRDNAELSKPEPWALRRRLRCGGCASCWPCAPALWSRTEWKNRLGSGLGDSTATELSAATITLGERPAKADPPFHQPTRGDRQGHRRNDRPGTPNFDWG